MKRFVLASFVVLGVTYGLMAHAQEIAQPGYFDEQIAAPASALEIGVSSLYHQGWGNLTDLASPTAATLGRRMQDNMGAGIGAELDLGYRLDPRLMLGMFGTLSAYTAADQLASGTNVRSFTAGLQGHYFFMPYARVNPWLGLGSGYIDHWTVPNVGDATQRHGWEVARLQVGVDLRATKEISVGPYIGGSVDTMFSEKVPGQDARNLSGPPVSGFFMAGLAGRFDLGDTYIQPTSAVAQR